MGSDTPLGIIAGLSMDQDKPSGPYSFKKPLRPPRSIAILTGHNPFPGGWNGLATCEPFRTLVPRTILAVWRRQNGSSSSDTNFNLSRRFALGIYVEQFQGGGSRKWRPLDPAQVFAHSLSLALLLQQRPCRRLAISITRAAIRTTMTTLP